MMGGGLMGGMLLGGMMADSQNDAYQESVFTFYRPNQRETDDSLSLFDSGYNDGNDGGDMGGDDGGGGE